MESLPLPAIFFGHTSNACIGRMGSQRHIGCFEPMVQGLGMIRSRRAPVATGKVAMIKLLSRRSTEHPRHTTAPGHVPELPDFPDMTGKSGYSEQGYPRLVEKVLKRGLASLQTTFGMVIAGKPLVRATPPRPGQHLVCGGRSRRDEPCQEMAHFRNGQVKHSRGVGRPSGGRRSSGAPLCAHRYEIGESHQHQGDVPVPTDKAPHFIVIQAQVFGVGKILFNGLITNDKFCMSRTARLQLSHWRLPRSARQTSRAGVESPVTGTTEVYLPQQEAYEETTMERSASLRGTA